MCGIIGYIGKRVNAVPILLEGLELLKPRGYDSCGIFVMNQGCIKAEGHPQKLVEKVPAAFKGSPGIAHNRWATRGDPIEKNAHPHTDCASNIWVVHNGVIENFSELKELLSNTGHKFSSDTDTELISHLVEERIKHNGGDLERAFAEALKMIQGTYGILLLDRRMPEKMLVARKGSPVIIGIGDGEYFVSSESYVLVRHTRTQLELDDYECAVLTRESHSVFALDGKMREREPLYITDEVEVAEKGGFPHFMLKEIMEAPDVLVNSARGRIVEESGTAKLGGIETVRERLLQTKRIIIVGCGSAYYAGMVGRCMLEEYAEIPVEVELGSEFIYRHMVLEPQTALLAISQSGGTMETYLPVKEAKRKGLLTLGIVNKVGTQIARETDAGIYNHAGHEQAVASTKAFVSQLEVLALLTLFLGRQRGMSLADGMAFARELKELPHKVRRILEMDERIKTLAHQYKEYRDFLYLGRKYNFPIAYEGALKLKEISYVHAEAYGGGEMKHGPLALIDEDFPTVAIVLKDSVYDKMVSNIGEIKTRKGRVLALATEGDDRIASLTDDVIFIPKTIEALSPILSVIPLQLFAYHIGVAKGIDVDHPRNLAKSVTVE